MPLRDRVAWGHHNPFADARLAHLDEYVRNIRQGNLPANVVGGSIFVNLAHDLPMRPKGYYREYELQLTVQGLDRGRLHLILGNGGEIYIAGNHHNEFRQIVNVPT